MADEEEKLREEVEAKLKGPVGSEVSKDGNKVELDIDVKTDGGTGEGSSSIATPSVPSGDSHSDDLKAEKGISEARSTLKDAISGLAKGAGAVGKAGGKKLLNVGGNVTADALTGGPTLFFIISILIHLFVIFVFRFGASTASFITYFAVMSALGLTYIVAIGDTSKKSIFVVSLAGAVMYCMPAVAEAFTWSENIHGALFFLAVIVPVWPIYMLQRLSQASETAAKIFRIYKILLMISFIVLFFGLIFFPTLSTMPIVGVGGLDVSGSAINMFDTFVEAFTNIGSGIGRTINETLNPGAYYTGRVEDNAEADIGVKFEDLRPIDRTITTDMPLSVYGTIYAKTFIDDEDSLKVVPSCVIDRRAITEEASVDPEILDIVLGTAGVYECKFGAIDETGTYRIKSFATFPFQTWAYITFSFVDDERARNLARQGLDVRDVLDIDPNPTAIFTAGPLKIGMGGTPQPIRINPAEENPIPAGTRIGLTLDPGWGSGQLNQVNKIELKVPEPFELYECDRCENNPNECRQEPDPFEPDYTNYVFENKNAGPITTYTSITCKLGVREGADLYPLISEADKTERSIIAVAYYSYTIEAATQVMVR